MFKLVFTFQYATTLIKTVDLLNEIVATLHSNMPLL